MPVYYDFKHAFLLSLISSPFPQLSSLPLQYFVHWGVIQNSGKFSGPESQVFMLGSHWLWFWESLSGLTSHLQPCHMVLWTRLGVVSPSFGTTWVSTLPKVSVEHTLSPWQLTTLCLFIKPLYYAKSRATYFDLEHLISIPKSIMWFK